MKLQIQALLLLAALGACSAAPRDKQQGASPQDTAKTISAKAGEPVQGQQPGKLGGPAISADYCLAHGDDAASPFGNKKACFMAACDRGDKTACHWAETYNGNLYEDDAAAQRASTKLEGMNYLAARKIVLSFGWKALGGPCEGMVDDQTCRRFPEIGNCSGTGLGFCDMHFVRKQRCLDLVTTEGAPNDANNTTQVRDVTFSSGPCAKDPNG